jgi:release factor glutamine methyltransferase
MTSASPHKTIRELIQVTSDYLDGKGVESAKLNAERLLADVLGLSRIELFFQHDRPVLGDELDRFRDLVRRRAQGQPLQQILGETEFYSRVFKVKSGVFIPRPETERLVEEAVALLAPPDRRLLAPVVVEIGCGTGIIGISLAMEIPRLTVYATDVNPTAVKLTEHNAHTLGAGPRIHVLPGNRFDPLPAHLKGQVDLVVSNPPYIREADIPGLAAEVSEHDPVEALSGGEDGLVFYRALVSGVSDWLRPGGHMAVEIGDDQGQDVEDIFSASGLEDIRVIRDYADRDRVVTARWQTSEENSG